MENQVLELLTKSVNLGLVVICLAIGYILKHTVKSLNNDYIPPILLVCGIAGALIISIPNGFTDPSAVVNILVMGIASGAASIGIHQTGKIFTTKKDDKVDVESEV